MFRIGISGWTYAPWRGTFYPPGLPHRAELAYVAERMNSVEVNGTFYALQKPGSFSAWAAATPPDFEFAVKGGRFLTHMKKLAGVEVPLANFLASGVLLLGPKLGPLLWQLPPTLGFDAGRLTAFCALLPRTHGAAAELARSHDARVSADPPAVAEPNRPIRHAFEVRHDSFRSPGFAGLMREQGMAVVTADNPGQWPVLTDQTADFSYVRLHGDTELYASGYTDAALDRWAARAREWGAGGRDVYVFCDNDAKVRAPYDAMALAERLGQGAGPR